jgi:L-rhamnose mutarotase
MRRFAQIIKVKPEKLETYKELHSAVWPDVLKAIKKCNISNYSIFMLNGLLVAYFEYTGNDYAADVAKMADDPITQQWWDLCKPCQEQCEPCSRNEWWATMEEVFHTD